MGYFKIKAKRDRKRDKERQRERIHTCIFIIIILPTNMYWQNSNTIPQAALLLVMGFAKMSLESY